MLYRILSRLIDRGQTDGMEEKLDVFYAVGKLTREEYEGLTTKLRQETTD